MKQSLSAHGCLGTSCRWQSSSPPVAKFAFQNEMANMAAFCHREGYVGGWGSMWFQGTIYLWWEWEVVDLQGLIDKWGHLKDEWAIWALWTATHLSSVGILWIWPFYPCPGRNEELICWLDNHHFRPTPLRTRPAPTSHSFPCHQATVGLSSHGSWLSCGFIMGRDGKQNHCRMKDWEKGGGKGSYKVHADLQIEKSTGKGRGGLAFDQALHSEYCTTPAT